jgi:hypothetical protein
VVVAVLLVVVGPAGRPQPRATALLPPRCDGKPEAATTVVVAPDDGHENARNMFNCIQKSSWRSPVCAQYHKPPIAKQAPTRQFSLNKTLLVRNFMTTSKQSVLQPTLTVITFSAPLPSFYYLNWLSFCHLLAQYFPQHVKIAPFNNLTIDQL